MGTDNIPVRGATVVLYDVRGRFLRMPDSKVVEVRTTDRYGNFEASIENIEGSIEVQLVRDICNWLDASTLISKGDIESAKTIDVVIKAEPDECPGDWDNR